MSADDKLIKKQPALLRRGLEDEAQAPDTVTSEEYEEMSENDIVEL